jgi:4'-phosphopantetheinyl transferase
MALVLNKSIDNECYFMVWKVEESEDFYKNNLGEINWQIEEYFQISHPHKQREWLASRFLAKKLAESLNINYLGLIKDAYNKPYLQDSHHHLSISHTTTHVAAAVHLHKPIGIDLEKISERLHIIKHKFLTDSERNQANDNIEILCIFWSAKESLYKLYGKRGVHFQKELTVLDFSKNKPNFKGKISVENFVYIADIHYFSLDNSYLTIAF